MKRTPLHYGAENGHVAVVEVLIRAGADVNVVDRVSYCVAVLYHMHICTCGITICVWYRLLYHTPLLYIVSSLILKCIYINSLYLCN